MNKLFIYILLFVWTPNLLYAQIPVDEENIGLVNSISEQVNLFTDRDLYLSGEEIWFTAFVLINDSFTENDLSKIIYLELIDGKKKTIFQGKFEINRGIASGSFQIPTETLSGNYFVRSYTQYQRNFSTEIFHSRLVTIINPELPLPKEDPIDISLNNDRAELIESSQEVVENVEIEIISNNAVYGKREPLELKIKMPDTDAMAALCVSVVRKGTSQQHEELNADTKDQDKFKNEELQKIFWIPETRGASISGIVSDKNTKIPLAGLNIYLSILGKKPQLHKIQTQENGAFIFSLGYLAGITELYLGIDPKEHSNVQVSVNNNFSNDFRHLRNIPILIDTDYKNLLEEMLVNYQTMLIFPPQNSESFEIAEKAFADFSYPEVSIRLADYIDLPNLESIFYELVPTVKVRDKEGKRLISVFDPKTEIIFPNQLLLLDHVPIFDCEAALGLSPFRIESIEVVNSTYYLGDNTFRNVVMINSKAHDFAGYDFPEGSIFVDYQTLSTGQEFISPVYKNQSDKNSRIPDFRALLYWNPEIRISKADTTLHFYTSDNSGVYEVFVRGFTKNGKSCFGQGSIKIQ